MTWAIRSRLGALLLVPALALYAGCEKKQFEPPNREARVSAAESGFDTSIFDTITWESDELLLVRGASVYGASCRRCHGTLGEGRTEYARSRGLEVPPLQDTDWWSDPEQEATRAAIFAGLGHDMPTFGIAGLTPREIDAVSSYLVRQLRPELLEQPADSARR